jgi:hypothetical protein
MTPATDEREPLINLVHTPAHISDEDFTLRIRSWIVYHQLGEVKINRRRYAGLVVAFFVEPEEPPVPDFALGVSVKYWSHNV